MVLAPPPRAPVQALARCLEMLRQDWQRQGHLAALWQAWPRLAGPQLAPHCRPLRLNHGRLTVGAVPGPWLQALQYHRHQLLGALRAAGFPVQEVRIEQHHATPLPPAGSAEAALVWQQHPSRVDQHGMGRCPRCGCPAPAGEMGLWGHCGFCRRAELARPSPGPATQ
jgi:predicted nucleic acid-binding Zn ribbon protein